MAGHGMPSFIITSAWILHTLQVLPYLSILWYHTVHDFQTSFSPNKTFVQQKHVCLKMISPNTLSVNFVGWENNLLTVFISNSSRSTTYGGCYVRGILMPACPYGFSGRSGVAPTEIWLSGSSKLRPMASALLEAFSYTAHHTPYSY